MIGVRTGSWLRMVPAVLVLVGALAATLVACGGRSAPDTTGTAPACGPQEQKAGEYTVVFETATCPAKAELNSLATIAVRGPEDRPVTDAAIVAHCDMPAMKMPTGTAAATPEGDRYRVTLALGMPGTWDIRLEVTPAGAQPITTTFTVNAK